VRSGGRAPRPGERTADQVLAAVEKPHGVIRPEGCEAPRCVGKSEQVAGTTSSDRLGLAVSGADYYNSL
jgi:hypothetical protein